jgi:hypothetical protein
MLTYIVPLLDKNNKIYTLHGVKLRTVTYIDINKSTKVISEVEQLTERMTREKYGLLTFPRTVTAEHGV